MRDFSWKYFTLTGDVESFMLYKEMDQHSDSIQTDGSIDQIEEFAIMDDADITH